MVPSMMQGSGRRRDAARVPETSRTRGGRERALRDRAPPLRPRRRDEKRASMELTSDRRPLYVDFLPTSATGLPGLIGLTIAPGKRGMGAEGMWMRDLDLDLRRLREVIGADVLVSLCEADELRRLEIPDLHERARSLGIVVEPFPVPDTRTPASADAVRPLVQRILDAAALGQKVVIHCMGGLGRSGLVAACVLIARGRGADEAMRIVRAARKGAIENAEQEAFVRGFSMNCPTV